MTLRVTSQALSAMRDLLTCPVCLDVYSSPRLLNCNHAFCSSCLQQLGRHVTPLHTFLLCPLCKAGTALPPRAVPGLPPCFWMEQIKDVWVALSSSDKIQTTGVGGDCEGCGAGLVDRLHCADCRLTFCTACSARHAQISPAHTVLDVSDEPLRELLTCTQHAGRICSHVCRTCSMGVCTLCLLSHDPHHHTLHVGDTRNARASGERGCRVIRLTTEDLLAELQVDKRLLHDGSITPNSGLLSLRL